MSDRMIRLMAVVCVPASLFAVGPAPATAQIQELGIAAFSIDQTVTVPGAPENAYDRFVEVDAWWDHRFVEEPIDFYLEAQPGGGFYEIFDDAGDGVLHATVIYAERGKLLRFNGPLGLSGMAIDMVFTLSFTAAGDSTTVALSARGVGEDIGAEGRQAVAQVWEHFLRRYKAYVEGRLVDP